MIRLLIFLPTHKHTEIFPKVNSNQPHRFLLHLKGQFVGFFQTLQVSITSEKIRGWKTVFAYKHCYKSKIFVIDISNVSISNFVIHKCIHLWILKTIIGMRAKYIRKKRKKLATNSLNSLFTHRSSIKRDFSPLWQNFFIIAPRL